MPERDLTIVVVREWLEKAENDLKNAVNTLKMGRTCPTDTVCFHAQQCAEKYIKSYLTFKQTAFPKTHDIGELMALMPSDVRFELGIDEQRKLTNYATGARYPGWGKISRTEARRSVAIARRIRKEIRRLLPRTALRRRKP